jgi:hypothetical protein
MNYEYAYVCKSILSFHVTVNAVSLVPVSYSETNTELINSLCGRK